MARIPSFVQNHSSDGSNRSTTHTDVAGRTTVWTEPVSKLLYSFTPETLRSRSVRTVATRPSHASTNSSQIFTDPSVSSKLVGLFKSLTSRSDQPLERKVSRLTFQIDEDILKGVSIHTVLRNGGSLFKSNEGNQAEFCKSVPVTSLSDFISHDWNTGRFSKTISLYLIYNGAVAVSAAAVFALFMLLLQSNIFFGVLPTYSRLSEEALNQGMWAQLLCPFVFLIFLCYWQQMRATIKLPTRFVFVDKCCINQSDKAIKEKGILSLAGFLERTDRLVVLWSPRYFTRLWCTYELAAWLYLQRSLNSVVFMPVAEAWAVICCFAYTVIFTIIYQFGIFLTPFYILLVALQGVVLGPFVTHGLRYVIHDLRALPQQIQGFSIKHSGCYCCSVSHKMPDTGKRLPCDRAIVYKTLEGWFPESDSDDPVDSHVDDSVGASEDLAGRSATRSRASTKDSTTTSEHTSSARTRGSTGGSGSDMLHPSIRTRASGGEEDRNLAKEDPEFHHPAVRTLTSQFTERLGSVGIISTPTSWPSFQWPSSHTLESQSPKARSFDEQVRALFGPSILQRTGPTRFPYRYALFGMQPFLWRSADIAVGFGVVETEVVLKIVLQNIAIACFVGPCIIKLVMHVMVVADRLIGLPQRRCINVIVSALCFIANVGVFGCVWAPLSYVAYRYVSGDWWKWYAIIICSLVVLTCVLYYEGILLTVSQYSERTPSQASGECSLCASTQINGTSNQFRLSAESRKGSAESLAESIVLATVEASQINGLGDDVITELAATSDLDWDPELFISQESTTVELVGESQRNEPNQQTEESELVVVLDAPWNSDLFREPECPMQETPHCSEPVRLYAS